MDNASPPPHHHSVTPDHAHSRSRSRSTTSMTPVPMASTMPQYSPSAHPATDPALLALSEQQIMAGSATPTDPALLGSPLPVPTSVFPIDPALGGGPPAVSPPLISAGSPTLEIPVVQPVQTLKEEEVHEPEPMDEEPSAQSPGRTSKRASVAAEDSDAELRRLADENKTVPLDELAKRVRNDEHSPSAERTRQVYGLIWLQKNCERVPDTSVAVPRNRVYARYVGICANERIKPLNPASFGKLVRLMFPEIKTRRLGVRGQSKYHYCGIRLAGENHSPKVPHSAGSAQGLDPSALAGNDFLSNGHSAPFGIFGSAGKHANGAKPTPPTPLSSFMLNELCFLRSSEPDNIRNPHDAFKIPDITPFVPVGTDPDIAATLTAIYRSHCTSLVECIRYMRLKQFLQLFVSFHGTLTVPVQRLLSERSIAPWIRESDWVMYKEMVRLLSPLALQVVPSMVLSALRQLSSTLVSHITTTFSVQPSHVTEAKVGPASIFASLLDRLLRVNDAAHAAARFLGHPPDRDQMIKDWKAYVNAQSIVDREVPCIAPLAKDILQSEIPSLLDPDSPVDISNGNPLLSNNDCVTTESVLDRWTNFLTSLPHRFRNSSPRHFNVYLGALATAALRDLTTNGAISFGSWWVVRCWVDEWMAWQAEKGGFLMHGQQVDRRRGIRRPVTDGAGDEDDTRENEPEQLILLEDMADNRVNRLPPMAHVK